jgi:hypothetical protein
MPKFDAPKHVSITFQHPEHADIPIEALADRFKDLRGGIAELG